MTLEPLPVENRPTALDSPKVVASRLKHARLALGLTQIQLTLVLGVSQSRWSQYETGLRRITIEIAVRLRNQFGIPLDWIYCGDSAMLPYRLRFDIAAVPE